MSSRVCLLPRDATKNDVLPGKESCLLSMPVCGVSSNDPETQRPASPEKGVDYLRRGLGSKFFGAAGRKIHEGSSPLMILRVGDPGRVR
jgi:hypothetical protein